ncbi:hypothetical protein [Paenibacillus macerans]|uniref:hypothetical protein n=1 Tax=Paenibacillus macerans TaxID=44252 RepID=UPI003D31EEEB
MISGMTMIVFVLIVGWLFYGPPADRPDTSAGGPGKEQGTGVAVDEPKSDLPASKELPQTEQATGDGTGNSPAAAESPYLLDRLPFTEEEVVSVTAGGNGVSRTIPAERQFVLLQSLRFTDMKSAAATVGPAASRKPVMLQFKLADQGRFELTYDLAANAFEYHGQFYYADDEVLLLMQGLFGERKELASLDALLEQARVEREEAGAAAAEPRPLDAERAKVDGLDFAGWEQRLEQTEETEIVWSRPFYDDSAGQVKQARLYKDGVLILNRKFVFTQPEHQTADGVKVGIGPDEVMDKLGPEALKLVSRWSYKVGDYYRFHVYFEDRQVVYIILSQPL